MAMAALSRSASAITMTAFLPPISQVTLAPRWAALVERAAPIRVEPVKEIALRAGEFTIASPTTEPEPTTMLNTPGGRPASSYISVSNEAVAGVSSAGLKITVFPATRAGADFHTGIAQGKFHGAIKPTTPSGRRIV